MNGISLQPGKKFFISWLACFIVMYGLSYTWHGIVLNDYMKISYPKDIFLTLAAAVYFSIAFGITVLTYALKRIKDSFKYGIAIGVAVGIFIYSVAFLFGLSFNAVVDPKLIVVDLGWQAFEQGFGGLICGWVFRLLYMREKRLSH